jgi:acyl-CoA thioester hydrolase
MEGDEVTMAGSYHETNIRVRFNEVDSYQVAWHGHYIAWMEEARNDLAGRFGVDAAQLAAAGYRAPVVALELAFLKPARFGEALQVRTTLVRNRSATLEFLSQIIGADGKVSARGRTVHALTNAQGVLQYTLPEPIAQRLEALLGFLGV